MTTLSPAFPLAWSSEVVDTSALVIVEGELDRHTAPALAGHLLWLLAANPRQLVLDTFRVSFADAGALELLHDIGAAGLERGCTVQLAPAGDALHRLVAIVGVPHGITLEAW
jgi:anti-anti-sigma factor